mmetsp:Transcript_123879/g.246544  ORF Transcript_123879/g.246544 Transcript_123879/m.246544 type:complete len:157 (+) Transcript_123879:518-988(+)
MAIWPPLCPLPAQMHWRPLPWRPALAASNWARSRLWRPKRGREKLQKHLCRPLRRRQYQDRQHQTRYLLTPVDKLTSVDKLTFGPPQPCPPQWPLMATCHAQRVSGDLSRLCGYPVEVPHTRNGLQFPRTFTSLGAARFLKPQGELGCRDIRVASL